MRKQFLIMIIWALPFVVSAQDIFEKYENMDGVTSVLMTSKMFKLLSKIDLNSADEKYDEFMKLVNSIDNIKIYSTPNSDVSNQMKTDVTNYLKTSGLDQLMRVNNEDKNVMIYAQSGKDDDHVKELFMFIKGMKEEIENSDTVILSISGDIDLKQVSTIADHLNVPGGDELKKVSQQQ